MTENQISHTVLDRAIYIHKILGPGLMESTYEKILAIELRKAGLNCIRQHPVDVIWEGEKVGLGYKADLIINGKVVVELKSAERVIPVHFKQVLTYIKLTDIRLGLLINFGEVLLKNGYHRVVNGLPE